MEPDIFKNIPQIFSLCSAQREITVACNKIYIQGERLGQIKVFCLSGEKSLVPSKAAALCESGEAEERVIDHVHF